MPDICIRNANQASGSTVRPFDVANWRFRKCPYTTGQYAIGLKHDGAAGGLQYAILIGTTEVVQRSDASAGGTDGVMPTPDGANSAPFHVFRADYQDEIILELYETGAVATTDTMIVASCEPVVL
jgi:hypothetical protein